MARDSDQIKLMRLREKLKKAEDIRKENKAQGKRLSPGRARAIAQMKKDIAALEGKTPSQQQQAFDSMMKRVLGEQKEGAPSARRRLQRANDAPKKPEPGRGQMGRKPVKSKPSPKDAPSSKGADASQRRFQAKTELARQKEMDAVGPGPSKIKKTKPITKKKELKQAPGDKRKPGVITKDGLVELYRQTRKDELKREKAAEFKRAQKRKEADRKATENKGPRTPRKKKVGKYDQGGEFQQSIQDFMKDTLGINVKFKEAEEEQDPGNNFAKGGFVTRKGPLYKRKSK